MVLAACVLLPYIILNCLMNDEQTLKIIRYGAKLIAALSSKGSVIHDRCKSLDSSIGVSRSASHYQLIASLLSGCSSIEDFLGLEDPHQQQSSTL